MALVFSRIRLYWGYCIRHFEHISIFPKQK